MGTLTAAVAMMATAAAPTTSVPAQPTASGQSATSAQSAPIVPPGTPVRLMVIKEINSRTARDGDRFKLRVDEPVYINGAPIIPVGATAWGEIGAVEKNGAVGKGGRLNARLLYLDMPYGHIPLRGEYSHRGDGNGAGVVMAVVGFGLLGLLTGGDSARLKAGDTFTGYVDGPSTSVNAGQSVAPTSVISSIPSTTP